MRHLRFFLSITLLFALSGCEKNVTVDIPKADEQLVVEGYIENGQPALLVLSRTLPFFGSINVSNVVQNTVQGARVIVSDGLTIDTLQQFPGLGVYYSSLLGETGKTYTLRVEAEGKVLTASTRIPGAVTLDSTWWKVDGERDSLGFVWARMSEPDTLGNCYRWFAQRINRYTFGEDAGRQKDSIFIAPLGSVFEDKFINGRTFDFSFPRGIVTNSEKEDDQNEERFFFKRGDTVVVKFTAIDRDHFEFWRTAETQIQNNGNPFGSPAPITSNISGGLGIWGGYAATFDTVVAQ
jgi:hypothetical protein